MRKAASCFALLIFGVVVVWGCGRGFTNPNEKQIRAYEPYLFLLDKTRREIRVFGISQATGIPYQVSSVDAALSSPSVLVADKNGRHFYVGSSTDLFISIFRFNTNTKTLSLIELKETPYTSEKIAINHDQNKIGFLGKSANGADMAISFATISTESGQIETISSTSALSLTSIDSFAVSPRNDLYISGTGSVLYKGQHSSLSTTPVVFTGSSFLADSLKICPSGNCMVASASSYIKSISGFDSGSLSVSNGVTAAHSGTIHFAFALSGQALFTVDASNARSYSVTDGSSGSFSEPISTQSISATGQAIAVHPSGNYIYTASGGLGTIDLRTFRVGSGYSLEPSTTDANNGIVSLSTTSVSDLIALYPL